jgi:hypothetical protein
MEKKGSQINADKKDEHSFYLSFFDQRSSAFICGSTEQVSWLTIEPQGIRLDFCTAFGTTLVDIESLNPVKS